MAIKRDITERHSAEEKQALLAAIVENSEDSFINCTPDGIVLTFNRGAEAVFGYSAQEVIGKHMSIFVPPEHAPALERLAQALRQGSRVTQYEGRCQRKDGRIINVSATGFPIRNGAGEVIAISSFLRDTTESRLVQRALQRSEEKFRRFAEHAREVIWMVPAKAGEAPYVSPAYERIWGRSCESIRQDPESWLEAIHPDDRDEARSRFARELKGKAEESEYRIRTPGGEEKWIRNRAFPVRDHDGKLVRVAGIAEDITEWKQHEAQLIQARNAADAANRAKSQFLANISHEIRTPLNGVMGMTSLLLGSALNPEQRHYAEVIESSAQSLLAGLNDILDISKFEAGKLEIEIVDFNLRKWMEGFAAVMAGRLGGKPLEFLCAVDPGVPDLLRGDATRLRQVLMNLAANAVKFTRQGVVAVRVEQISEDQAGVGLRFSVRDTGIGIPADKQPLLFTRFTQVDASMTRRYGGAGLGLAISKQLVELMGGQIGVESREGAGSEFWFTVRLDRRPASAPVEIPAGPVHAARILVADGHTADREALAAQLQSSGAVVSAVDNGPAALAHLREAAAQGSPFQLAALDGTMPGMDGAALAAVIRADETLRALPLVMLTSAEQEDDPRMKEIGFAAYLVKPVRQFDLLDCVVQVLNGDRPREALPIAARPVPASARRGNARILLVEDNLTNQEVAGGILRRLGWPVDVAGDGKQALQALATQAYDLVLMDVQMPEMDGHEATRHIRDPKSSVLDHGVPVIALTAHSMAGDADECFAAGMDDYISKPVDSKTLGRVVEKWLARRTHLSSAVAVAEAPAQSSSADSAPVRAIPVFNREAFLQRMMGDDEFAREVAAQFLVELPSLLANLKEGAARKDVESISKLAHKIKGSAANVGGDALKEAASDLEKAGKAADLAGFATRVAELESRAAHLQDALQQWRAAAP
jgi:PAS domain S-box-containing protein